MRRNRVLLRKAFRLDHAQLQFGSASGNYPQWDVGTEPVVASDETIVVATRPDFEGNAVNEVWKAETQEAPEGVGVLIHDGLIDPRDDAAEAGMYLGGNLERVHIGRGKHRVRAFVDEPGYATRIVFLVTPPQAE